MEQGKLTSQYTFRGRLSLKNKERSIFYKDSVSKLTGNSDEYTFDSDTLEEILTHVRLNNLQKSLDQFTITFPNA